MIKLINFTIKIILTLLTVIMWYVNLIIVLIMWDGKFMIADDLVNLIWEKPDKDKGVGK
tara:strand:+ start:938 stop:1114 length:177 start_codon:yes stop_codon:yes gene_type:complete